MYNLFISHSWSHSDSYEKLITLLRSSPYFTFRDYSVPRNDPIHSASSTSALKNAIMAQMSHASCVLVLAGVYATYSKWIDIEIELAKSGFYKRKNIVAIEPWGAEKTSTLVKNNADIIVKWQAQSIIDAIREYS